MHIKEPIVPNLSLPTVACEMPHIHLITHFHSTHLILIFLNSTALPIMKLIIVDEVNSVQKKAGYHLEAFEGVLVDGK